MLDMMNALAGYPQNHQAMMDWRQQRPDHMPGMGGDAWHQAIQDWRGMRPGHQNALLPQPGMPNTQFPLNPQQPQVMPGQMPLNPVGSSYGVIGAQPATSPFGLPTY